MSWQRSNRKARLPENWESIRREVGERDRWRCQWMDPGAPICGAPASDCDHIKAGDDHDLWNLRMLCKEHHAVKSSSEGGQASWAALNARKKKAMRPALEHPVAAPPAAKPRIPGM